MSQHRPAVSTVAAVADLLDGVSRLAGEPDRFGVEWDRRKQLLALGRAVRELRARHGLSQEQLGFACGLHRNYVGAVERGEVNSTFRILILLTAGLDEPLSELIALYERNRTPRHRCNPPGGPTDSPRPLHAAATPLQARALCVRGVWAAGACRGDSPGGAGPGPLRRRPARTRPTADRLRRALGSACRLRWCSR